MKLELTTEQINQILNALAQQPFIRVHELINNIQQQGNAQMQSQEPVDHSVGKQLADEAREHVIND